MTIDGDGHLQEAETNLDILNGLIAAAEAKAESLRPVCAT